MNLAQACLEQLMQRRKHHGLAVQLLLLLSLGCSVETVSNKLPPILAAVAEGDKSAVEGLMRNGIDINLRTDGGRTALDIAASNGNAEMVTWLLQHNADPTIKDGAGQLPSDHARRNGHEDLARYLDSAIDTNELMQQAAKRNDLSTLRRLVHSDPRGLSVLHVLILSGDRRDVLRAIENGEDPNTSSIVGATPLHVASMMEDTEVVSSLILHKVRIDARNMWGWTPLMIAASRGNYATTKLLMESGADITVKAPSDGSDSLALAEQAGHSEVARLISAALSVRKDK